MRKYQDVMCYAALAVVLSACGGGSMPGANFSQKLGGTNPQRYVNLSVPLASTPMQQMYVLNSSNVQMAYWTLVKNSFADVNPAPGPYFNLPLTPSASQTVFFLVTPASSSTYTACSLTFDINGNYINQPASGIQACQGMVSIPNKNYKGQVVSSLVTVYNMGANFGNAYTLPSTTTLTPQVANQAIPREIVFKNNSSYDVCLVNQMKANTNAAPTPSQMCGSGNPGGSYQTLVASQSSVHFSIPSSGLDSGGWMVAGYRTHNSTNGPNDNWLQTGFSGSTRVQAATKVEPTIFPYYPTGTNSGPILNSVGPTNIDISSVDGANLAYKFYPEFPVTGATRICTLANNNVLPATQYTGVFNSLSPISYFSGSTPFACNSNNMYQDAAGNNVGCESPCAKAHIDGNQTEINETCCIGPYATNASCTGPGNPLNPQNSWYTTLINGQFINSYSFAFDDAKADFTCDPFASYVFEIDNVGAGIVTSS